jgi:hypothetical protein
MTITPRAIHKRRYRRQIEGAGAVVDRAVSVAVVVIVSSVANLAWPAMRVTRD